MGSCLLSGLWSQSSKHTHSFSDVWVKVNKRINMNHPFVFCFLDQQIEPQSYTCKNEFYLALLKAMVYVKSWWVTSLFVPFFPLSWTLEYVMFGYERYPNMMCLKSITLEKSQCSLLVFPHVVTLFFNYWRNSWAVLFILFILFVWIIDKKGFNKIQGEHILIHMEMKVNSDL